MRALILALALLVAAPVAGHAQTNPQVSGTPTSTQTTVAYNTWASVSMVSCQ